MFVEQLQKTECTSNFDYRVIEVVVEVASLKYLIEKTKGKVLPKVLGPTNVHDHTSGVERKKNENPNDHKFSRLKRNRTRLHGPNLKVINSSTLQ